MSLADDRAINILSEERDEARTERDQLQRDLDRLLEATLDVCAAPWDEKRIIELRALAQEIEAGHREKGAPNG